MIRYRTGDIFQSGAQILVNTVNCEGYMGKGIAYQFKKRFPQNNEVYKKACREGDMKIGTVLIVSEDDRFIINFPTKDKWRKKSDYSYIEKGMDSLLSELPHLNAHSIAIPPLGCGNGGLEWTRVKTIIESKLKPYEGNYEFIIYEPSNKVRPKNFQKKEPKLKPSHLILMRLKVGLSDYKFNKTRLQKTAFMVNLFSGEDYFRFEPHHFGPYAHSIDIISREIKEFQEFHNLNTEEAYSLALSRLISNSVENKLKKFESAINKAVSFINSVDSDRDVELLSTILYILKEKKVVNQNEFRPHFENWSKTKSDKFSDADIRLEINMLKNRGLLRESLLGIELDNRLAL